MKNFTNNLLLDRKVQYQTAGVVVLLIYIVLYFIFLYATDFLPYVFDNNETFSSLIHAQNLYHFGLKNTFGLTDEAYGLLKSAHPYVYTHQGNFPRFYAFLLYCLGAKTAESQIFITTFTVGLAGIAFCYHYFAKYVSALFAVIFCLLLMTDYIMFAQWQVNTWRVWHLFFFYSSFLCCHGLNGKKRKTFIAISILNFACLFYMEFVFGLFVFFSTCVYLFVSQKNSMNRIFFNFNIFSLGALLGISILIAQNIAYLGWNVFFQDLFYTFTARNHLSSNNPNFIKEVTSFYSKNHIIFWGNFNSIEHLRTPVRFLKNLYRYCLLPYTPYITLLSTIVLIGSGLSYLYAKIINKLAKPSLLNSVPISKGCLLLILTSIYLIGVTSLAFNAYPLVLGKKQILLELTSPSSLACFILLGFIFCNKILSRNFRTNLASSIIFSSMGIFTFLVLSIIVSYFNFLINYYTDTPSITGILQKELLIIFKAPFWPQLISGIILLISIPNFYPKQIKLRFNSQNSFKKILPFLLSSVIGFICVYLIIPGYVTSGYWYRSCSFTVFFHMSLYAWLFYTLTIPILNFLNNKGLEESTPGYSLKKLTVTTNLLKVGISFTLLLIFIYLWVSLQLFYIKEFPPTNFRFVQLLKNYPYHNRPIVSNTYAAPFAFIGQTWAYFDPLFGNSIAENNTRNNAVNHLEFKHSSQYLWFLDAAQNYEYQNPQLFVCWFSSYSFDLLGQSKQKCQDLNLVRLIRTYPNNNLNIRELAHDESGQDTWTIMELRQT